LVHNFFVLGNFRLVEWKSFDVRPIIEEANENAPAFSRIFKEMILFASADKPLPRAGKGTVQFKAAISLYAPEIESMYVCPLIALFRLMIHGRYDTMEEQISAIDLIEPPVVWEVAPIDEWLLRLAANVSNFPDMSSTVDLRHQGFDR
jgi:hypothetical protein